MLRAPRLREHSPAQLNTGMRFLSATITTGIPVHGRNGYGHVSYYKLKADAPDDAVDSLSKHLVVPLLEKMLASGAIREYEIDVESVHTTDPNAFWIVFVASSPEGLDQVEAGIREALKAQPLAGPAFGSMTESSVHRDELLRGDGVYK